MKAILLAALVLLTALAAVPSGAAKPLDDPQCMPVYSRTDVGQLSIVRPDSCQQTTTGAPTRAPRSPSAIP